MESTQQQADKLTNTNQEWQINTILGVKKNRETREVDVLVNWRGKDSTANSWEKMTRIPRYKQHRWLKEFREAIEDLKKEETNPEVFGCKEREDEPGEYQVERIWGIRWSPTKKIEYLIEWMDYDEEEISWEPEEHVLCTYLLEPFKRAREYLCQYDQK